MGLQKGGTLFDNVSLRFVSAVEDDSVWPIPNGDFEILENVVSAANSYTQHSISNTAAHWTFDNDGMTSLENQLQNPSMFDDVGDDSRNGGLEDNSLLGSEDFFDPFQDETGESDE